jgi:hypothetical protein
MVARNAPTRKGISRSVYGNRNVRQPLISAAFPLSTDCILEKEGAIFVL